MYWLLWTIFLVGLLQVVYIVPNLRRFLKIFMQESGSNWKQSGLHHVADSYLKPVLLWTGAILICRLNWSAVFKILNMLYILLYKTLMLLAWTFAEQWIHWFYLQLQARQSSKDFLLLYDHYRQWWHLPTVYLGDILLSRSCNIWFSDAVSIRWFMDFIYHSS